MWDSFGKHELNELEDAARALGVRLDPFEVRASYELETSVKAAVRRGARALVVLWSPNFYVQRFRVARLATEQGLATVWDDRDYVEAGGFMSYGPNYRDTFERAAYFVDRILKGAKPADLPVEQPTRFELVLNLKTAKALGLSIPQSLHIRADHIIR